MSACIIRLIFRNRYIARLPCFVLYNKSHAHIGLYHQTHLPEPIYRLLTVLRLVNNGCN
ncbi:hypothetical protein J6590_018410 [Homalodisca vitripennis]|nr:hypothetical protein J6590_018410 [Homalodisca vitripennis]